MTEKNGGWGLFDVFGLELEYMIVSKGSLDVLPVADVLIHSEGKRKNEVRHGDFLWSNELVMHVVELKTRNPVASLTGMADGFQSQIALINGMLESSGACLLSGAMHPWMDPITQTHLWPHANHEIYECFHRVFDCRGHGWSNLQSAHLNLPFKGDHEFRQLHSCIRIVLPLISALAGSSPFVDGKFTGNLCQRMNFYAANCSKIPSITGYVIPDVYKSQQEYIEGVFNVIQKDMASHDPESVLEPEWTNARGAIARFSRQSIEIRVMDIQECPQCDIAIHDFTIALLKYLIRQSPISLTDIESVSTESLTDSFFRSLTYGVDTEILDPVHLQCFNITQSSPVSIGQLVESLLNHLPLEIQDSYGILENILKKGSLGARLTRNCGLRPNRDILHAEWNSLASCLNDGTIYG